MVMCKVTCPECGMVEEVSLEIVSSKKPVLCLGCGIKFTIDSKGAATKQEKVKEAPKKVQTKKTKRKTLNNIQTGGFPKATSRNKRASRKRKTDAQTQTIIKLSVGGLVAILFVVMIAKFAGSGSGNGTKVAKSKKTLNAPAMASLETSKSKKAVSSVDVVKNSDEVQAKKEEKGTVIVQNIPFAKPLNVAPASNDDVDFESNQPSNRSLPKKTSAKVAAKAVNSKVNKSPMILSETEEFEMLQLKGTDRRDLSVAEKKRLDYLMNKYNWFKTMRYQYSSRSEMEMRWAKRNGEIEASNEMVRSRSDSTLSRPLQILLEGITDIKERAYRMRIYMKPVSFKEKEMVRKARAQAAREREDRTYRYKETQNKEKPKKILIDEYGDKYYLDENGSKVYVD